MLMELLFLFQSETKWSLVRNKMKLKKGSSNKACRAESDSKAQLFGQQLSKICPDEYSLPKPVMVSILWIFFKIYQHFCNSFGKFR